VSETATTREIIRVCDLRPGDRISGVDEHVPLAVVNRWDGSNLTITSLVDGAEPHTMHLVDYMDALARYSPEQGKQCADCDARLAASDPDVCEKCDLARSDDPLFDAANYQDGPSGDH
jgi:hypothetical protein